MDAALSGLLADIETIRERFEAQEPSISAFLAEGDRFERLRREAHALRERGASPDRSDPPLFGMLVGVKDLFHVDGFPTRAGSRLPASEFQGSEADCVTRLKGAGALVVGKTVTTEFAYFTPGPTRNPRNVAHTPGGSSSGSAAAVAAGLCDVALGTQTVGSIVRPAAFCGIVGLKPTFDRISTQGVVPLSPSLDHVGCFSADVRTAVRAARVLYLDWREPAVASGRPVLGIPTGPYLDPLTPEALTSFEETCRALAAAGFVVRRVPVMADYAEVRARHERIMSAEAARVHAAWFEAHRHLYSARMAALIERGRAVRDEELRAALEARDVFRSELRQTMREARIDAWIAPSAAGPAPRGLDSTGDPVMNLPWTQAGLPAMTIPAGESSEGLPLGVQIVADWGADERLVQWAGEVEALVGRHGGLRRGGTEG